MKQKKLWFKAKNYGWGWYPATWEGWAVTLIFIVLITLNAIEVDSLAKSQNEMAFRFIPLTFIYALMLIVICYLKGERPEWRWGGKKIKK